MAEVNRSTKPLLALLVSGWLTWQEWRINHPPEIALIAVIHFVVVLVAISVVAYLVRWLLRGRRPS